MIIAVDFDGTIVEHEFPDIGEEKLGAISVMKKLQKMGHKIVIWTCREEPYIMHVKHWCIAHGFKPDAINENAPGQDWTGIAQHKIYADYYLDDRGFPPFPGWNDFLDHILKMNGGSHE